MSEDAWLGGGPHSAPSRIRIQAWCCLSNYSEVRIRFLCKISQLSVFSHLKSYIIRPNKCSAVYLYALVRQLIKQQQNNQYYFHTGKPYHSTSI